MEKCQEQWHEYETDTTNMKLRLFTQVKEYLENQLEYLNVDIETGESEILTEKVK